VLGCGRCYCQQLVVISPARSIIVGAYRDIVQLHHAASFFAVTLLWQQRGDNVNNVVTS